MRLGEKCSEENENSPAKRKLRECKNKRDLRHGLVPVLAKPLPGYRHLGGGLVRFEGESDTGVCSDGARHMGSTVYSGLWVKGGREASAPPRPPPPSRDAALRPASLRAPAVWGLGFSFFRGQVWVEGSGLGCKGSGFRD